MARPLPTLGTDFIAQYIEPSFMPTSESHLEKVIDKVPERGLAQDVDSTQHQLEDGCTISTQERVVKDVRIVQNTLLRFATHGVTLGPGIHEARSRFLEATDHSINPLGRTS